MCLLLNTRGYLTQMITTIIEQLNTTEDDSTRISNLRYQQVIPVENTAWQKQLANLYDGTNYPIEEIKR